MTMDGQSHIVTFGYGSLVNLNTLTEPFIRAFPATLKGWRRRWLARPKVDDVPEAGVHLAFLSVARDAAQSIDGMVIFDHPRTLDVLTKREEAYTREQLYWEDLSASDTDRSVDPCLYVNVPLPDHQGEAPHILRSYLDAVSQGFLTHFGEAGLERFKSTTENFHFPILEDRDSPIYPRPVDLSKTERSVIDTMFPAER